MQKKVLDFFSRSVHANIIEHLRKKGRLVISGLANNTVKGFLLADFLRQLEGKNIFWVVNSNEELINLRKSLDFWQMENVYVCEHQLREDNKQENINLLSRIYNLHEKMPQIVLLNREAFLSDFPTRTEMRKQGLEVFAGLKQDAFEIINFLIKSGYQLSHDQTLQSGQYHQEGGVLTVFPPNLNQPVKIEFLGEAVEEIFFYDQLNKKITGKIKKIEIWPTFFQTQTGDIAEHIPPDTIFVEDELDIEDEDTDFCTEILGEIKTEKRVIITAFPDDNDPDFFHLRYLSLLRFHNFFDLANDLREKKTAGWRCLIFTKNAEEFEGILKEENILYSKNGQEQAQIHLWDASEVQVIPHSFQNTIEKIELLTDKEIVQIKKRSVTGEQQKVFLDFLTKLKVGDYVVHIDNGIGIFLGTEKKTVDGITREYIKLGYAQGDKLYVPIDQAEKTNKYIGQEDRPPHLTRLGSMEWKTVTGKVKKETEAIAQELLELYAVRENSVGHRFIDDTPEQEKFEKTFPYEETPGQMRALRDVKADMESKKQMDRLVCGDVGFGKTEVAMRAAFKAVQSGKQAALISPITILADQHYKSFQERMGTFPIKVEMLSRFRTPAEQKKILTDLENGKIDIIIGTHRLIQPDVKFKNLGLVIIDEEQRFGVKQKEALKKIRTEVDVLTLTATPIPRTLNMALNGIRDISTITTPPPGRLPVITEVRRFSETLIKQVVEYELARGGQIYFLHNRVQTIESMADKLRVLIPQAKIVVGHGKLSSQELEKRIMAFKNAEYNVLVSSTIIENGIDLSNANTLIVNNADQFGLSQLYQLRGRVGRGKVQAYAYMLYQAQRLTLESKKRLRAIVEAAELGSGFQIAMRDLEIRGAGDILGVNQHGAINVVGVTHFVRLLRQAVEELKSGKHVKKEYTPEEEVSVELPISGYIPDSYIEDSRDKINAYQRLSSADTIEALEELHRNLEEEYGALPEEVKNLFRVLELKIYARRAGITNIRSTNLGQGKRELAFTMGQKIKPVNIFNLISVYPDWKVVSNKLKIDMSKLGVHWMESACDALKQLTKRVPLVQKAK